MVLLAHVRALAGLERMQPMSQQMAKEEEKASTQPPEVKYDVDAIAACRTPEEVSELPWAEWG